MPIDLSQVGKGCIEAPPRLGSEFRIAATPLAAIDWGTPFRVPANLPQRNQDGSLSCTAQATAYYVQALNQIEHGHQEVYSARHIYSQVFAPGGGAYIWAAMRVPIIQGAAAASSVPDGNSSELIMTDRSDNYKAVMEAKTDKYAALPRGNLGINYYAQIIRDYHGFVTGFNGWNGMFSSDGTVLNWSKKEWGHAVYVCGYEIHKGQKCLVFKNSWGSGWGDGGYGYLPEEFVNSGMVYDAHVYADIADLDPMSMFKLVQVPGDQEVWVVKNGKKTHVFNQEALLTISEFASIIAISQADLDAIPDSGMELMAVNK